MLAERLHSTIEDPYAAVREARNPADVVPQGLTNHFKDLVKRAVIRTAFPGQRPGRVIHRFLDKAQRETPFRFVIEDEHDAIANADLILMDHQGPKMDDIGGVDGDNPETVRGTGGSEGLYAHALLPPHTRYVLKNYLVSLPVRNAVRALARFDLQAAKKELSQIFMALAFRKTRPIVVDRTTEKPPREQGAPPKGNTPKERRRIREARRAPHRTYVEGMREERRRTATEICRSVQEGTPVMLFPEGTRSNDGKIQGFVSEYFQSIVTDYILPRLEDSREIRIGILAADILSAFPDGVGTDVRAYDAPITLRGFAYDRNHHRRTPGTYATGSFAVDRDGNQALRTHDAHGRPPADGGRIGGHPQTGGKRGSGRRSGNHRTGFRRSCCSP
jgi:hypothetical protein